jgi:hypothetical protein
MKKSEKATFQLLGLKVTSKNIFSLILIFIIVVIMIGRTLYINKKLSNNTITIVAEVIDLYKANHGQRLWGYEMKYKYIINGKEFIKDVAIQKNEMDKVQIGDCIEVIISLEDENVQKWNKSKGPFKCP